MLEKWPTARLPGFTDKLLPALPALQSHTCSFGAEGGFVRRMREGEGTWMGHVLEHVAIELQQQTGAKVTFGKTRQRHRRRRRRPPDHVVYEYEEERVGEAAGDLALDSLLWLLPEELRQELSISAAHRQLIAALDFPKQLRDDSSSPRSATSAPRPERWCAPPRSAAFPGCA